MCGGMKHVYSSGLKPVVQIQKWLGKNSNLVLPKFEFFHITKDIVGSLDKAIVLLFKVLSV